MEENQTELEDVSSLCEGCCYDSECHWYGKPLMIYVGDELDEEITGLHNINQHDNAASGDYHVCAYNAYLLDKNMGFTDASFDEWYEEDDDEEEPFD